MNKHLSVGVIGHVDHGKTSLVRALTGMDTDRLQEEKERGMSIVLGFAWLEAGTGMVDLIDVPGHENFIRTMVAGATGIDAVLLVVDAREGVKPQTTEHLAITSLLGIRRGLIAISKCDQAASEQRLRVLEQVRGLLKGSPLETAPAVFVSSKTGEGLDQLKQQLRLLLDAAAATRLAGNWYLPIDRVFSMPGSGTVVTGTLRLGRLRTGMEAELLPGSARTSVRRLQFHGQDVDEVLPGQRAGVNLRHVKTRDVARGDVLAAPGLVQASTLFDARLTLLPGLSKPVGSGQMLRLLCGTTDARARLRLLGAAVLEPGEQGFAQIVTDRPLAAVAGAPFILRSETPPMTLGGGHFLDTTAQRHRSGDARVLSRLQVLASGSRHQVVVERLKQAGFQGITTADLALLAGIEGEQLVAMLGERLAVPVSPTLVLYAPHVDALGESLLSALAKYHEEFPARAGAPLSWCRSNLPRAVGEPVFRLVLQRLCQRGAVSLQNGLACIRGHDPLQALSAAQRHRAADLERRIRQGGLTPPDPEQLLGKDEDDLELLYLLAGMGKLLLMPGEQAGRQLVFHRDAVDEAVKLLHGVFPPPAQFTVSQCRAALASTRKYIVPLLEYLDAKGLTRRSGDQRSIASAEFHWR